MSTIQGLVVLMCFPIGASIIVQSKINTTYVFNNTKYKILYRHHFVKQKLHIAFANI